MELQRDLPCQSFQIKVPRCHILAHETWRRSSVIIEQRERTAKQLNTTKP